MPTIGDLLDSLQARAEKQVGPPLQELFDKIGAGRIALHDPFALGRSQTDRVRLIQIAERFQLKKIAPRGGLNQAFTIAGSVNAAARIGKGAIQQIVQVGRNQGREINLFDERVRRR